MGNMKSMMVPLVVLLVLLAAAVFSVSEGARMHRSVLGEEAAFHELQREYFTVSKAERDAAETGSALNRRLVEIQNYPSELLRLKLVGVGKILIGVFFALLMIAFLLFMMPVRLAAMMKKPPQ